MKKALIAIAAVCAIACMTSCEKKCSCTTTVLGQTSTSEFSRAELEDKYGVTIEKCSDLNLDLGVAGTVKCVNAL